MSLADAARLGTTEDTVDTEAVGNAPFVSSASSVVTGDTAKHRARPRWYVAKGYPAPKQPAGDAIPRLVPEGTCVICKKRPAEEGRDKCAECRAALAR